MTLWRLLAALALAAWLHAAGAADFVPVPPLSAHVIDQVGMLDARQRATLDSVLAGYEQKSGSQIVLLLMSSTAPEAIEQYSIRVADAWRLGRKGIDDGVILVVARDNPPSLRRLRIEAGRGVQGSLTDAQSKRILEDVIAPYFRRNDFYGGLNAGVSALATTLDREHLPAPAANRHAAQDDGSLLNTLVPLLFFLFLVVVSRAARRGGGSGLGRNGWGSAAGVILGNELGRRSRGDFGGGGFGSGGFGGGGFGGGGFSGGGGGFDGGGASGNW